MDLVHLAQLLALVGVVVAVLATLGRISDTETDGDDEVEPRSSPERYVAVDAWSYVDRRTAGSRPTWAPVLPEIDGA